ncbi:MAG: ATP-binding protein, partial [Candidatus Dechloromonas phosphoritropha]
ARELHDELGALLVVAKMDANWLLRSLGAHSDQGIRDRFQRLIDNIGASIRLKRSIIDDLRPPLLHGLGLLEALRGLADSLRGDIPIALELPAEDPQLVEAQSLALFRIAQESLTNIRKYAQATQIQLGLAVVDERIVLWVADNGNGFDPSKTGIKRHGLAGMKHRVQMFGGKFTVTSAPGTGTRIEARMPMQRAEITA